MPALAAFFFQHWKTIIIGAALLAVFAIMGEQHLRINSLKSQRAELQQQVKTLTAANEQMAAAVDQQNTAIVALKAAGDKRQAAAAAALAAANKTVLAHQKRIAAIMAAHPAGVDCVAANELLTDYIKGETP